MEFGVGSVLEGKVTGITKFGAFVSLPEGKSGLVHISEIAYTYVNDVKDHLQEGQEVKVKVIGIDENGRINLSIKKAMDPPPRPVMMTMAGSICPLKRRRSPLPVLRGVGPAVRQVDFPPPSVRRSLSPLRIS